MIRHVLVVDRELFPDGACVDCYLDLGRGAPEAGCIAAGITYSGRIIANVAAGVFVQHVHRRLKANHFFIDLNSCTAEFMFLRKRGAAGHAESHEIFPLYFSDVFFRRRNNNREAGTGLSVRCS